MKFSYFSSSFFVFLLHIFCSFFMCFWRRTVIVCWPFCCWLLLKLHFYLLSFYLPIIFSTIFPSYLHFVSLTQSLTINMFCLQIHFNSIEYFRLKIVYTILVFIFAMFFMEVTEAMDIVIWHLVDVTASFCCVVFLPK